MKSFLLTSFFLLIGLSFSVLAVAQSPKQIALGDNHSCYLTISALPQVKCFGSNMFGQLGNASVTTATAASPVTVQLPPQVRIDAIFAGGNTTCAYSYTTVPSSIYCWGDQLIDLARSSMPVASLPPIMGRAVMGPFKVDTTAIGHSISFVASADGGCFLSLGNTRRNNHFLGKCFGKNEYGQVIGNGTVSTAISVPLLINNSKPFVAIGKGLYYTCLATVPMPTTNQLWCAGKNHQGQLGVPDPQPSKGLSSSFQRVLTVPTVTQIAATQESTCIISNTGTVWCFGSNSKGQLGMGNLTGGITARMIPNFQNVKQLAGTSESFCGLSTSQNGSNVVSCWGGFSKGRLGLGQRTSFQLSPAPLTLPTGVNPIDLKCGTSHCCLRAERLNPSPAVSQMYCWGSNEFKQAGSIPSADVILPRLVN
ncbi:MAG: RCC1 domain-containing protein [Bacteriovoracaceae bacterium]